MGWYEIRVTGRLGPRWAARLDGMSLIPQGDGTTLIEGRVTDQAALHGLLRTLGDLGLPLVSVTEIPPRQPTTTHIDDTTRQGD